MRRTQKQLKEENEKFRISKEDNKWIGFRFCPDCGKELKYQAQEEHLVRRNIRNAENEFRCCDNCRVLGEKNPFFGKKHTEKTKKQVSISRKGKAVGEENSMAKKENRDKISIKLREGHKSGRLDYVKEITRKTIQNTMRLGKLNLPPISSQEKEIESFLINNNIQVETQFLIENLRFDIYIKNTNLLIEFNGDYWHGNPEKYQADYFNKKKQMYAHELWACDEKKKLLAENNGYQLLTIWEKDYKLNKEQILNDLIKKIYESKKD